MNSEIYRGILERCLVKSAKKLNLPRGWIFHQDIDPNHTAGATLTWFQERDIELLEWPSQSPDFNPIENLWQDIETEGTGERYKKSYPIERNMQGRVG